MRPCDMGNATLRSKVSDIFNMAAIAAFSSDVIKYKKN